MSARGGHFISSGCPFLYIILAFDQRPASKPAAIYRVLYLQGEAGVEPSFTYWSLVGWSDSQGGTHHNMGA